jgi:CRISPR-associated protein Csb1
MPQLTYDVLRGAVDGAGIAFRSVTRLEPVGGPGDKLFPPTFGDEVDVPPPLDDPKLQINRRTKYAVEWRRIEGKSRLCVLLDSVASQANRMEEALLDGWEAGELGFPMVRVDFTDQGHEDPALDLSTLGGDGYLTVLEVPHRLADALLRDSLLDGVPFRYSAIGRRFTEASFANAGALFDLCPTALVFGLWDSTGPKGGLGSKFQRALVSEIVGIGAELGVKTASRIDPAGIEKTTIYEAADPDEVWTLDPELAAKDNKGNPVPLKRGGAKAGSPSVINHGNVTPTVDPHAGGVTIDYAEQTTVLSLSALRRLRFPRTPSGEALVGERRREAESAARAALAALGLAAIAYSRDKGYDLRSRCALRPLHGLVLELVTADGAEPAVYSLDRAGARQLLAEAAKHAADAGLPWRTEPIDLRPMPKLVALIRESRKKSVVEETEVAAS